VIFLSNDDDNKSLSLVLEDDDTPIGVNISAIDLLVRLVIWMHIPQSMTKLRS
jgi:hypothetical protein